MKAFVAIVFVLAFIDFGYAIKCYTCVGGADCADPFTPSSSVLQTDCSSNPAYDNECWKAILNDGSITRSCSLLNVCALSGIGCRTEQGITTCCCNNDLCNSASTTGISCVTIASMMVASFLSMM